MIRFSSIGAVTIAVLAAQAPVRLTGDWQARAGDEIRHIMVRGDSSAQFGSDVARWRVVGDSLWITLGDGVWMVYGTVVGKADHQRRRPGEAGEPETRGPGDGPTRQPDHSRRARSKPARLVAISAR
jgi:hypothetical protein